MRACLRSSRATRRNWVGTTSSKTVADFLLVDLVFLRVGDPDRHLEVERHGDKVPLFDKGDWLRPMPVDEGAMEAKRNLRLRELQT